MAKRVNAKQLRYFRCLFGPTGTCAQPHRNVLTHTRRWLLHVARNNCLLHVACDDDCCMLHLHQVRLQCPELLRVRKDFPQLGHRRRRDERTSACHRRASVCRSAARRRRERSGRRSEAHVQRRMGAGGAEAGEIERAIVIRRVVAVSAADGLQRKPCARG